MSIKPFKPFKPSKHFKPFKPFNPFKPIKPLHRQKKSWTELSCQPASHVKTPAIKCWNHLQIQGN